MRIPAIIVLLSFSLTPSLFCRAGDSGNQIVEAPITDSDREHWAFAPLARPEVPQVEDEAKWVRSAVDRFVLARLEEKGIAPQPEADWDTLVRRLSFDLTGLPPKEEMAGSSAATISPSAARGGERERGRGGEKDHSPPLPLPLSPTLSLTKGNDREKGRSPDDYERLVDRLLASPAYGERWAQHWLDLARFAETDGFEHDKVRPDAWQYRDWVITALNADLPYDEFVRLQLAGDLMSEPRGLSPRPDSGDGTIAREGHGDEPRGSPVPTMFALAGPDMPDINSQDERRHYLLNELTSTVGSVFMGLQVGCAQCHDHKYDPISQADFYRLRAFFEPAIDLKKDVSVSVLKEQGTAVESRLWVRGDHRQPGPLVAAAFPRIANPADERPATDHPRLTLANWLTRGDHPLTSRVMANRIWQHHFGRGVVDSPSDFGLLGSSPTHPELLDWLATELVRCDWSLKTLHRRILNSAVYRQDSARGGERESGRVGEGDSSPPLPLSPSPTLSTEARALIASFPRRRLDGEAIRDAMLAAAGLLDRQAGGPGVMPPLPSELTGTLLKGQWQEDPTESNHYRRSIYLFARRNLRYPLFDTFDRPDANASCPQRSVSTTALQSLQMVNSEFALLCARHLAAAASSPKSKVQGSKSEEEQSHATVRWLVRRVFGREASQREVQLLVGFLKEQTELLRSEGRSGEELALPVGTPPDDPYAAAALVDLCLALFNASEFVTID